MQPAVSPWLWLCPNCAANRPYGLAQRVEKSVMASRNRYRMTGVNEAQANALGIVAVMDWNETDARLRAQWIRANAAANESYEASIYFNIIN